MRETQIVKAVSRAIASAMLCAALFAPIAAHAAEHPSIDDPTHVALDHCLASKTTKTTYDIRDCYQNADRTYEKILTKTYASVLAHLDAKSGTLVKAQQRAWLAYQARTLAAYHGPWSNQGGTFAAVAIDESGVNAVRARIIELHLFWRGYAAESDSLG